MKPTPVTTAHVACWTIRERSSSRMGRWSLERSTALKPAAASPCRATAWRLAAWLRLETAMKQWRKDFLKTRQNQSRTKQSTSKNHTKRRNISKWIWRALHSSRASNKWRKHLSGATPPKHCSGVTNVGDHQMISMSIACYRLAETTTYGTYTHVYAYSVYAKDVFFCDEWTY